MPLNPPSERRMAAQKANAAKAASARRAPMVDRLCENCRRPFAIKAWKARVAPCRFCSNPCRYAFMRGSNGPAAGPRPDITGPNHPAWKGGVTAEARAAYMKAYLVAYRKRPHVAARRRRLVLERLRSDPRFALNHRMRCQMRVRLRRRGISKGGRGWAELVGYTVEALKAHLEAQFLPGMSWENAGEWHIDHKRPLASFSFSSPDDPEFREAWAITNLQPLWGPDNRAKGARLDWTP